MNTTISDNTAPFSGGGLAANGTATFTDCTISDNTTDGAGGGINNVSSTMSLTNCTVTGNDAVTDGGGVYTAGGSLQLRNVTVSANTASSGGGIDHSGGGTLTIVNTIVSANSATTGPDILGSINTDNGFNLLGAALSGTTSGTGDIFSNTPMLEPLGYYGGPTQTFALEPGSPAVGAGNNTGGPSTDQRGFARSTGIGGDIGALEATFYTVTTTTDSVAGSLRAEITAANSTPGSFIEFNIPGTAPFTIQPGSALPAITSPVILDATTEPGYAGTPLVELNGASAGSGVTGLTLAAGSSMVKGLVIDGFTSDGIDITSNNNVIQGNYIGTDSSGTTAVANSAGISIAFSAASNTIGGTTAAARNVLSGNSYAGVYLDGAGSGNVIEGNYIGTNAAGLAPLANTQYGIDVYNTANVTIGGTAAGAGNVISANGLWDVYLEQLGTTGTQVQGNTIGLDATGTTVLGSEVGVLISNGASSNTIGGTTAASRNVITAGGRTLLLTARAEPVTTWSKGTSSAPSAGARRCPRPGNPLTT